MAETKVDIKAIELLKKEVSKVKAIPNPPKEYSQAGTYKKTTEKVISECTGTMKDVVKYAKRINSTIDQVKAALKEQTTNIQYSIEIAFSVDNGSSNDGERSSPGQMLQYAKELQQVAHSVQKLQEFMIETEIVFVKVQENVDVTMEDLDTLKGYLESWKLERNQNYKEERQRLEEEKRERRRKEKEERRLLAENKRKEEEKRRKREEERRLLEKGRKRQEEEEKRQRERRERMQKEEEERKKKEEEERERLRLEEEERLLNEERKRKEEEDRLKREEEERLRREEEEGRKREEEERRKLEEETRLRELEKQRLEAERLEKERRDREEAARKRRLDQNNWKNTIYNRRTDQVDGDRSYHKNVCCVLSILPPISQADKDTPNVECLASDEVDDIIETLHDGEKLASSVVNINSKEGEISLEVPLRAFLPHCQVTDSGDELIMKVSVNGRDWVTSTPLLPTQQIAAKSDAALLGTEIDNFEYVKLVLVARRKTQNIIVDKPGISQHSNYDKNIKLFIPRDTVSGPTELKMSVKPITDETLSAIRQKNPHFEGVLSVGSLMTLSCQSPFAKDIELDLRKSDQKTTRARRYHLYRTSDQVWKIADTEYKGRSEDVTVILPTLKSKCCLIRLDLSPNVPKEYGLQIAESMYDYTNKTAVRVILRQNQANPTNAIVHCVKREMESSRLAELRDIGYTLGTDGTKELYLSEGQKISVSCSGNIGMADGNGNVVFPFFVYMDTAKAELTFHVKDRYKQKDLQHYIGNLVCTAHDPNQTEEGHTSELRVEIPITLPKLDDMRQRTKNAPIRFPYYLSSLAYFLSCKLTERDESMWYNFMENLGDKRSMQALYRRAKRKVVDKTDEKALCRAVLLDWMKTTERQKDKVGPIEKVLEYIGLSDLRQECHNFVVHLKEHLSDAAMTIIARQLTGDPKQIGSALGLDERLVTTILQNNPGELHEQIEALLLEWRHSEAAINSGISADEYLKSLLDLV